jgi:hypothetical protein
MNASRLHNLVRLLAYYGEPLDQAVVRFREEHIRHIDLSVDDGRAALAQARVLVGQTHLLAPALKRFVRGPLLPYKEASVKDPRGPEVSAAMEPGLRVLADEILDAYISSGSMEALPDVSAPMRSASLQYAAAIVRQQQELDDFREASTDPASLHSELAEADRRRLEVVLLGLGELRVDPLIHRWRTYVSSLERDATHWLIEEFDNALILREDLQLVFSAISPGGQPALRRHIDPLDQRFAAVTQDVSSPIRLLFAPDPPPWWRYRVPRQLGEDFTHYLRGVEPAAARELGLLPPTN